MIKITWILRSPRPDLAPSRSQKGRSFRIHRSGSFPAITFSRLINEYSENMLYLNKFFPNGRLFFARPDFVLNSAQSRFPPRANRVVLAEEPSCR